MNAFLPTWQNVKPLGRTCPLPDALWLAYSAAGAEFTFHGRCCEVVFAGDERAALPDMDENHARVAVYVDGVRTADTMIDAAEKTVSVCCFESAREVTVRIVKLSETAMATCGIRSIRVDAADIRPTPAKKHRIEVVGDSITCGYGVDDEVAEHHFKTSTEDVTRAYAYRTAQLLDADYSLVSISGYGIISGYTATAEAKITAQTLPQYYSKLGFCYGAFQGRRAEDTPWDHAAFQPELIVINLGTNDDSYCLDHQDRQEDYRDQYIAFLKDVRRANPEAKLLCILGIMGTRLCPRVAEAAARYTQETGDQNIAVLPFEEQLPEDGRVADWHPTALTHGKAAEKLAAAIRDLMSWPDGAASAAS